MTSIPTLEIDLAKIASNYNELAKLCNPAIIGAVVKANAYGLGAIHVADALVEQGCQNFFVTSISEAINLRNGIINKNINIFVLNGVFYNDIEEFILYNLTPVLNHIPQLELWNKYGAKKNVKLEAILNINTGMSRLGMSEEEIDFLLTYNLLISNVKFKYVMSHLTSSEDKNSSYNLLQLNLFKQYLTKFPNHKASFANSGGIFLGKQYHFNMVRPGAAIYGIEQAHNNIFIVKNPIKLLAPIIQLQTLEAQTPIGYNNTYYTDKKTLIATIPLGYADGYSRKFSNQGIVFIDEYEAKIVGRISMDLITIDVTHIPRDKIFLGKSVEIIGDNLPPDKLAKMCDTLGYEIITLLGARYSRKYI